jgi:hypothetical protein
MKSLSIAVGLTSIFVLSGPCNAQVPDDPFSDYLQRSVTITLGAGNAKDTNAAIHTIDPWPPYVGYTRIPGDGRRATAAIQRMYRVPSPFARQDLSGEAGENAGGNSGGSAAGTANATINLGSGPPTPVQPLSGN